MTEYAEFEGEQPGEVYRSRRRTAMRVAVPIAVAVVAATGIGLVPALASDSAPTLPQLTAEQLVGKALASDTQQLSGTVKISTDLGIPAQLVGALGGGGAAAAVTGTAGAAGGSGQAKAGNDAQSATPQAKLTALLAGDHTLRISADGPDKQRLALVEPLAEYDLIRNGDQLWAWDSSSDQAVHLTAPAADGSKHEAPLTGLPTTPQEAARQFLTQSAASTAVTVDGTATVAGRSAYELSLKPTQAGSTIREVRIAVDAANGVPLAVVATTQSGSTALDVHFTDVSFAKPAAKTFDFTPPKGAKVTDQSAKAHQPKAEQPGATPGTRPADRTGPNVIGTDWTTVLSLHLPAAEPAQALPNTAQGRKGHSGFSDPTALIKSFGKPVNGGTLISTKVLNVLITDDGRVFAGAVTAQVLQSAAGVK